MSIRFSEADLEGTAANLRHGRSDLAITYDLGLEKDTHKQQLYALQPQVICSGQHKFARLKTIKLSRLHRQQLILLDQPLSSQYVLGLLKARQAEPEIVRSVKSFELQRSLVANNFGIALTHTLPRTHLSYDGLPVCAIPISDKMIEQRMLITCLEQNRNRPVLNSILAELSSVFAQDSSDSLR